MLKRLLEEKMIANLNKQKATLLLGARRVGKTLLLQSIVEKHQQETLLLNGEDQDVHTLLEERTIGNYKRLLQGFSILIIDEAQFIPDIGRKAKLMIDEIKPLHIILTGSSAFHIEQLGEPLTGRTISHTLYPIAQAELTANENLLETKQNLEERLIYGSYPEVLSFKTLRQKQQYLIELINTYLLKDILVFEDIRNPQKLKDLLGLLAFQVGNEVSLDELGRQLGMSKNTVERYLDLLCKVFVLYRRGGFSRNLRKEIVKSSRWYFFDNGVRNAIINNFAQLATRQDIGMLWENYAMVERQKRNDYSDYLVHPYFWRTYDQQEVDLIEVKDESIAAYELKWKEDKVKKPVAFGKAYPDATFSVVTKDNYLKWIEVV